MELVKVDVEPEVDPWEAFWLLYPRHVAKKDAYRAWLRVSSSKHTEILTALSSWRKVWLDRNELQFVPYPASWINGERWEDELPVEYRPRQEAKQLPRESSPKTEMPDHVRALIAKLRSK